MSPLTVRCLFLLLAACLGLAACHREPVAPGNPVAAIKGMVAAIRDDDLVRYSRLSMPPALHKRMEVRWKERLTLAAAPTQAEEKDYQRRMGRLTGPDAEQGLYLAWDKKLRKIESGLGSQWPMMQATGGIFVNGMIKANDTLTPPEKAHAKAVGAAFIDWLTPQVLTDRERARRAIAVLANTASALNLPTLQDTRRLEMIPALRKGGQVLKGLKRMASVYGLDANAALDSVDARLVSAEGDQAVMEVSYPLFGKKVSFELRLVRRDGRWYSADAVRKAEVELSQPLAPEVAAGPGITGTAP